MKLRKGLLAAGAAGLLTASLVPVGRASAATVKYKHVLVISVDGLHAVDYENCVNGGYCPNLASLGKKGVNYLNTSTSKPSDSFPGLMSIMTGGTPRTMGVNYDVAYDRGLNAPTITTGNGLPGGPCTAGSPTGTTTEYDEGIDLDQSHLTAGAPSGDPGVSAIDPMKLVRDVNCNPVYPWNFVRDNTVYGVIHAAGGYTAWADKHPSYSSVGGPSAGTTDTNVNDYYGPEINSNSQNFATDAPVGLTIPACLSNGVPTLPDQAAVAAADDYTGSFQNIQCYDGLKATAILNEINGMNHDGTASAPVPAIFGMNFQAVSIGEKLIYQHGTVAPPYSQAGGYLDNIGTPSASLKLEIEFADFWIGNMITELKAKGLSNSTLVIITAKHGQSPIDTSRYIRNGSPNDPASILSSFLAPSENSAIGPTEDDVALLWLASSSNTTAAVAALEAASPTTNNIAGLGEIFSGITLNQYYDMGDSRAPDILVIPNYGVTYSNSAKKQAEHGGFGHDDTNVILLVSNPGLTASTVTAPVETRQVAPTILTALGLNPNQLTAVKSEGTVALPGVPL